MPRVRRVTLRATLCVCMLALSAIAASGDQSPQQLPVFRAGTVLVRVDVYPRIDGRIVPDLTKEDFQVFENGKAQPIDGFEFIRIEPNTPDVELRDPRGVEESNRQAADPRNRLFVVYLDTRHTSFAGGYYTREPLLTFLRRAIGPTDLFGVMTPDLPINRLTFARRIETIEAEIDKVWPWSEAPRAGPAIVDPTEEKLQLCAMAKIGRGIVAAHREDVFMTSLEQLLARLQTLRDERKNVIFFSEGWIPTRAQAGVPATNRPPTIPPVGVDPVTGRIVTRDPTTGDVDKSWCEREAARLMSIDFEQRFRLLLTRAQQANVGFYPVDVAGLRADLSGASRARLETLLTLASATEGTAVAYTNDLTGAVRKVADDFSSFYLLGYYSTDTKADGAYRRIEVKVRTPGVKVTARPGYFAPTAEMLAAETAAREKSASAPAPASALDVELGRLGRIRTDTSLFTSVTASSAALNVVVEIASRDIESGGWSAGGAVALAIAPGAQDAAPIQAQGRIEPGARSTSIRVPVGPGSAVGWRVRARVTGPAGALEDETSVSAPGESLVGDPVLFRAGASPRSPLSPVADLQFRRTERIHVEWSAKQSMPDRSARLLSRRGDPLPLQVTVTERPGDDGVVLAADAALAPLAQGDYVLELLAGAGTSRIQKLIGFRVVR